MLMSWQKERQPLKFGTIKSGAAYKTNLQQGLKKKELYQEKKHRLQLVKQEVFY